MQVYLWKKPITREEAYAAAKKTDDRNKVVIFKNCVPFTDCNDKTNKTQADKAKDLDVVMLIYNLIE